MQSRVSLTDNQVPHNCCRTQWDTAGTQISHLPNELIWILANAVCVTCTCTPCYYELKTWYFKKKKGEGEKRDNPARHSVKQLSSTRRARQTSRQRPLWPLSSRQNRRCCPATSPFSRVAAVHGHSPAASQLPREQATVAKTPIWQFAHLICNLFTEMPDIPRLLLRMQGHHCQTAHTSFG